MDLFGKLFGDPVDLVKRVITHTSAAVMKPLLVEFFNHRMNAKSRMDLGKSLVDAGQALQAGEVANASDQLAGVIGEIKF
jgi:hypothetical protein